MPNELTTKEMSTTGVPWIPEEVLEIKVKYNQSICGIKHD